MISDSTLLLAQIKMVDVAINDGIVISIVIVLGDHIEIREI